LNCSQNGGDVRKLSSGFNPIAMRTEFYLNRFRCQFIIAEKLATPKASGAATVSENFNLCSCECHPEKQQNCAGQCGNRHSERSCDDLRHAFLLPERGTRWCCLTMSYAPWSMCSIRPTTSSSEEQVSLQLQQTECVAPSLQPQFVHGYDFIRAFRGDGTVLETNSPSGYHTAVGHFHWPSATPMVSLPRPRTLSAKDWVHR